MEPWTSKNSQCIDTAEMYVHHDIEPMHYEIILYWRGHAYPHQCSAAIQVQLTNSFLLREGFVIRVFFTASLASASSKTSIRFDATVSDSTASLALGSSGTSIIADATTTLDSAHPKTWCDWNNIRKLAVSGGARPGRDTVGLDSVVPTEAQQQWRMLAHDQPAAEITEKGTEVTLMTSGAVADGSLACSELEAAGLNAAVPPQLGVAGPESAATDAAKTRDLLAAELQTSGMELSQARELQDAAEFWRSW
jgi:hypothetical protein